MNLFGLPQKLDNGLTMRWALPQDADELAAFNVQMHSDDLDEPETWLGEWTQDLMRGDHPTTQASDFTVVVDENAGGKIVSSMGLISQKWMIDGIEINVGRPELVATDPEYRQRGLVRVQFDVIHAKSEARSEMIQAITGIPWYYRQFGYEMALDYGGSHRFYWHHAGNDKPIEPELFQIRPAIEFDIPVLTQLYAANNGGSLLTRVRDATLWRYEMGTSSRKSDYSRSFHMIETACSREGVETVTHEPIAYIEYQQWGTRFVVREFGVKVGCSWRPISLFITRFLKKEADRLNESREKPITAVSFNLGTGHAVYEALGSQLDKQIKPYAWFIRVPDLPAFLRHIAPALERRLAKSVLVGHSGTIKMNFYRSQITLKFECGKLVEIGSFTPEHLSAGDVRFPELTFLQLLFGRRSFEELDHAFADCYVSNAETAVLLNILFPKQPSWVVGLG